MKCYMKRLEKIKPHCLLDFCPTPRPEPSFAVSRRIQPTRFRVVVMNDQRESRAVAGCRPFEHLLVAIRVTKRSNRTATNVHLDADRFASFVVDELNFGHFTSTGGPSPSSNFTLSVLPTTCSGRSRPAHNTGPSIAMALFQSRRVIGHWATISAVTSCDWVRYVS